MDKREDLKEKIINTLKTVYDPEIPLNIYDFGLIYGIDIDENFNVSIKMTLTSPNCPVAESMPAEVEQKTAGIKEVRSASVEIVWDPPFSKEMMSEEARFLLGMF